jgi:hypothetical protein
LVIVLIGRKRMFGKSKKLDKAVTIYAGVSLHLSAKTADELKKELGYSEEDSTIIMLQIITFCILNLMRTFATQGVSVDKGRNAIAQILKEVAKTLAPNTNDIESTYRAINQTTEEWIKTYARLPLGEKMSSQAGTLTWEYSKLIVSTAGKNPLTELSSTLLVSSRIVNVNDALETQELIASLR